jgi:thiamine transporter
MKGKGVPKSIRPYVEASLLVAVALVISTFTLYRAPMGGAVTLGSTLPICIVSFRSGTRIGILAGLNFGILTFLTSGLMIGIGPFILDYLAANAALGLFGWLRKFPILAICLAQTFRLLCHVASGVLYFSQGLSILDALDYSLRYNLTFLVPDVLIGIAVFYKIISGSANILGTKTSDAI